MIIYEHRINSKQSLLGVSPNRGVEVDIRTDSGKLILAHDPFVEGELFSDWLTAWNGQPLILNVKEDSLEESILDLLDRHQISDYFFLDQSYPSIRRMISQGIKKVATRVSDFEDLRTALSSGSEWVWLDSFSGDWSYIKEAVTAIHENNQKTCLVSPELQRPGSESELIRLQQMLYENHLQVMAVCTKKAESWSQ
jgi:hypothetical protein